jgi:methylmalonyl-CoA/ethylmalonyl-CoA epimerase
MLTKIDHIGIAVHSLDESIPFFENVLGLTCEKIEEVPSQKVKTAFFAVGDVHLELLEPMSDESPIAKFLENKGPGVHHVAYQSDDVQNQLDHAAKEGCRLIHETPIDGAGGKKVAFLHPKSTFGVLSEFCSKNQ